MKAMLLPSALAAEPYQYLTTFLVNGTVAIDAGSLGLCGSPEEQSRVRHVFLTHAHMALDAYPLAGLYARSGDTYN